MPDEPSTKRKTSEHPLFNTSVLLVALLVLLALLLFLQSAYFYVREVKITGLVYLTPDEVRAAASLHPGVNYWEVDESAVAQRLLLHPRIKEAHVDKVFPRQLVVNIVERLPVALVPYDRGFLEVSKSGVVLAFHPVAPAQIEVPFFTGVVLDPVGEGLELPGTLVTGEGVEYALAVAGLLGPGGRADFSELHWEKGQITLYTVDAVPVYLGEPEHLEKKVEVLLGMLEDVRQNSLDVHYIDVRVPAQPVLRLHGQ